jgi:hypothetical protein
MAKHRSPNYPAIGLSDAVEAVRAIYEGEKRTQVSGEVIAHSLGYSSLSGPARTKISALKKYGLLEGDERKGMRVSDLAVRILYPNGTKDELGALREAALNPELFKLLYNDYRDGSDGAIMSHLINKMDFAPHGAKQLIAAFRDTYSYAGLDKKEYNNSETSDKSEAGDMQTQQESAPTTQADFRTNSVDFRTMFSSTDAFIWPLSKPRGVKAELRITGDYTRADLDRLKKQIDILVESLDDEAAE